MPGAVVQEEHAVVRVRRGRTTSQSGFAAGAIDAPEQVAADGPRGCPRWGRWACAPSRTSRTRCGVPCASRCTSPAGLQQVAVHALARPGTEAWRSRASRARRWRRRCASAAVVGAAQSAARVQQDAILAPGERLSEEVPRHPASVHARSRPTSAGRLSAKRLTSAPSARIELDRGGQPQPREVGLAATR